MIKLTDILKDLLTEDRCKRIADRKYDKPSAYKSGAIVRCRDGKIWKDLKEDESPKIKGKHIIYHAGDKKITKLVPDFIKGGPRALYGWGVYFSDSIHKAKEYGNEITYLDISYMNILDLRDKVDASLIEKVKRLANKTKKYDKLVAAHYESAAYSLEKHIGNTIYDAWREIFSKYTWNTDKFWSEMIVKIGYDIMKYGYEYVVINLDKANHYLIDNETGSQSGVGKYINPNEPKKVSLDDIIPDTEENDNLRSLVLNSDNLKDIKYHLNSLKGIQNKVKNVRDYNELQREIELLEKLLDSDYAFDINENKRDLKEDGLEDTYWINDKNQKITLKQLLNVIKDYPIVQVATERIEKIVIKKDSGGIESNRLNIADIRHPIIIVVDDIGNYKYILDGNHRANKAIDAGLKSIPAKLVNIKKLPRKFQDILNEVKKETLHNWFKHKGAKGKESGWVDCNTCRRDKKTGRKKCKSCGRKEGEERSKYPSCRPTPSQCSQPGKGKKWGKTK